MLLVKAWIGPSRIHGIGCFTAERIAAGQPVWVFDPRIDTRLSAAAFASFPKPLREFLRRYGYEEMYEGIRTIVLSGDHARYMNHADQPNLIDGDTDVAARDIEAGEELTCNYYAFDLDAHRKLARTPAEQRRRPVSFHHAVRAQAQARQRSAAGPPVDLQG